MSLRIALYSTNALRSNSASLTPKTSAGSSIGRGSSVAGIAWANCLLVSFVSITSPTWPSASAGRSMSRVVRPSRSTRGRKGGRVLLELLPLVLVHLRHGVFLEVAIAHAQPLHQQVVVGHRDLAAIDGGDGGVAADVLQETQRLRAVQQRLRDPRNTGSSRQSAIGEEAQAHRGAGVGDQRFEVGGQGGDVLADLLPLLGGQLGQRQQGVDRLQQLVDVLLIAWRSAYRGPRSHSPRRSTACRRTSAAGPIPAARPACLPWPSRVKTSVDEPIDTSR